MTDAIVDNDHSEGKKKYDLESFSCLLQPPVIDRDAYYIGVRRILLCRKNMEKIDRRKDWRCHGMGYVAYRNFIKRPSGWEKMHTPSCSSTPDQSGRWISSSTSLPFFFDGDSWTSSRDLRNCSQTANHATSSNSSAGGVDHHHTYRKEEPAYSFVGMHCIFDQCRFSVTVLKFGSTSSDLLAYGASDGRLTVCSVSQPPSVIKILCGHTRSITDFDFSANNQYISSSSMDKTVRIWEISKGTCIRVIYGASPQLCIRFHPVNNNFLFVGNGNKEATVINFSTGRITNKAVLGDQVTAIDHDHTGQLIFCGDGQGSIYTLYVDSHTGILSRCHRHRGNMKHKSPVTTVQYRIFSLVARGPALLSCTHDGNLSFFNVSLEARGYLSVLVSLKLISAVHSTQISFCPVLSLEKGEYIVSGSDNSNVYFYDLTKPKHTCVRNKLQGHVSSVSAVAWNHGENLLASSDSDGTVIVWKRAK